MLSHRPSFSNLQKKEIHRRYFLIDLSTLIVYLLWPHTKKEELLKIDLYHVSQGILLFIINRCSLYVWLANDKPFKKLRMNLLMKSICIFLSLGEGAAVSVFLIWCCDKIYSKPVVKGFVFCIVRKLESFP